MCSPGPPARVDSGYWPPLRAGLAVEEEAAWRRVGAGARPDEAERHALSLLDGRVPAQVLRGAPDEVMVVRRHRGTGGAAVMRVWAVSTVAGVRIGRTFPVQLCRAGRTGSR